jgi:hypothetical protein
MTPQVSIAPEISLQELQEAQRLFCGIDQEQMRFVTHNDVSREDCLSVLRVVGENC